MKDHTKNVNKIYDFLQCDYIVRVCKASNHPSMPQINTLKKRLDNLLIDLEDDGAMMMIIFVLSFKRGKCDKQFFVFYDLMITAECHEISYTPIQKSHHLIRIHPSNQPSIT